METWLVGWTLRLPKHSVHFIISLARLRVDFFGISPFKLIFFLFFFHPWVACQTHLLDPNLVFTMHAVSLAPNHPRPSAGMILTTVKCRYKVVQYNMILHTSLQELRQNISQRLNPQKTPLTSHWPASYGVSFANILEKIDCIITAPHCTKPIFFEVSVPTNDFV